MKFYKWKFKCPMALTLDPIELLMSCTGVKFGGTVSKRALSVRY